MEVPSRPLFAGHLLYGSPQAVVIRWPHKLVWARETGEQRVWNLESDPGERRSGAPTEPALVEELSAILEGYLRSAHERVGPAAPAVLAPETHESLRALGYIE